MEDQGCGIVDMKDYREIHLQIDKSTLDELAKMLFLRKITGNDIGMDYEFGVLVLTAIMEGKESIFIGPKAKKKKRKKK